MKCTRCKNTENRKTVKKFIKLTISEDIQHLL